MCAFFVFYACVIACFLRSLACLFARLLIYSFACVSYDYLHSCAFSFVSSFAVVSLAWFLLRFDCYCATFSRSQSAPNKQKANTFNKQTHRQTQKQSNKHRKKQTHKQNKDQKNTTETLTCT